MNNFNKESFETEKKVKLYFFNSDSGNRDFGNENSLNKNTSLNKVLEEAIKLKANLVTLTSKHSIEKQGQIYIKAFGNRKLIEVKTKVETNVNLKNFLRRKCIIIEYVE